MTLHSGCAASRHRVRQVPNEIDRLKRSALTGLRVVFFSGGLGTRMRDQIVTITVDGQVVRCKDLNPVGGAYPGATEGVELVALAAAALNQWRIGADPNRIFTLSNPGKDKAFLRYFADQKERLTATIRSGSASNEEIALRLVNTFGMALALNNGIIVQQNAAGTGDAAAVALDALAAGRSDTTPPTMFVLPDDFIIDLEAVERDYTTLLGVMRKQPGSTGIITVPMAIGEAVDENNQGKYGIAWMAPDGTVLEVMEKPDLEAILKRTKKGDQVHVITAWVAGDIREHLPVPQTVAGGEQIALTAEAMAVLENPGEGEIRITEALARMVTAHEKHAGSPGVVAVDSSARPNSRFDVGSPEGLQDLRDKLDSPYQPQRLLEWLFTYEDRAYPVTPMMRWVQNEFPEILFPTNFFMDMHDKIHGPAFMQQGVGRERGTASGTLVLEP
jgi:hypothetical protein